MSDREWERIRRDKEEHRARLAALPFEEKLRILERLRRRTQALMGEYGALSARERSLGSSASMSFFTSPYDSLSASCALPPHMLNVNAAPFLGQSAHGTTSFDVRGVNSALLLTTTSADSGTPAATIAKPEIEDSST